ncbi:MAG: aminotransferase class V-fold PLP-dependent enzyme [Ruminococcaceae bacterium]|nr:aminotransferase class V-fold PLP-dependent enzyme [Oscillospiraceae bacterium]
MIYLDNSATTFPKPKSVINAVSEAMQKYSANPGRSGHNLSLKSAHQVFTCREAVCRLFNIDDESKVIFTSGCTQSLNTVIKGVLKPGDHCVISSLEHNSVLRPLEKLKSKNISYSVADVYPNDNDKTLDSFRQCINEKTKLIVCTHASNVFGIKLPVERICALAHSYGILFCLDAAQSAGVLKIDIGENYFDYVCCAGHKGLYGPMGVGLLIINTDCLPDTLFEGGTGSESQNYSQPLFTPDRYESGTLNIPGICGLKKGVEFVLNRGLDTIFMHEMNLVRYLYGELNRNDKITLYTDMPSPFMSAPVLSFSVDNMNSEKVAAYLNKNNIAVRAGLHCSPLAHKYMGTIDEGVVRISPSVFTTQNDIKTLVFALNKLKFMGY